MSPSVPLPAARRLAIVLVVAALVAGGCSGGDGDDDPTAAGDTGPNAGPLPTLEGGLDLDEVDPLRLLVGRGLAYGTPLPSEQVAADAYLESPEVTDVAARRIHSERDGRRLGDAVVLSLDGSELFDESVLDAFPRASVGALGDGRVEDVEVGGRAVLRSVGPSGVAYGVLEGNQLALLRGDAASVMEIVIARLVAAMARGDVGTAEPHTPLAAIPVDAAFVPVPTVTFAPFPAPEDEVLPEPPTLPGATAVQGRYGVVAGERRTTVWAYTLDPATYPSAEALQPALAALVSARAGGTPAEPLEVGDRVVLRADGIDGAPSARAFRHRGLVLLVEGDVPAQVDAVVSAWIQRL